MTLTIITFNPNRMGLYFFFPLVFLKHMIAGVRSIIIISKIWYVILRKGNLCFPVFDVSIWNIRIFRLYLSLQKASWMIGWTPRLYRISDCSIWLWIKIWFISILPASLFYVIKKAKIIKGKINYNCLILLLVTSFDSDQGTKILVKQA